MKKLTIPYYTNGYNLEINNCFVLMIAGAAGNYNLHNYFYINALWSIYTNYNDTLNFRNILNKVGIDMLEEDITKFDNFLLSIRHHINNNQPVLFPTACSCLYFLKEYGEKSSNLHWLLFDGYDENTNRFIIRDFAINKHILATIFKTNFFSEYFIMQDGLQDIFVRTSNLYADSLNQVHDKLIYLCQLPLDKPYTYEDIVVDFLEMFPKCPHGFADLLSECCEKGFDEDVIRLRNKHFHSFIPLFDALQKGLASVLLDSNELKVFSKLQADFLNIRRISSSILQKYIITKKASEYTKIQKYIIEIKKLDNILFDTIETLYRKQLELKMRNVHLY